MPAGLKLRNPFAMECGVYKTTYEQDMALHPTPLSRLRLAAMLAVFVLFPLMADPYYVSVANLIAIAAIGAIGLNLLTGFTGQISIGHGAFIGVGAYTSGYLTSQLGVPFWVALPLAGIAAAVVGALFGLPSLRLKGLYLAMATLAAQVIIEFTMYHWTAVTGGSRGLLLTSPSLGGFVFNSEIRYYYLFLALTAAAFIFAQNLTRTRVGRAFMAIRDRDLAAEVTGIELFHYKIMAFAVSSFYAGVAGTLWGHYLTVISPEHFTISTSVEYLAMIIIGGLGNVTGSIFGAAFMTLIPILLRGLSKAMTGVFPNIETVINALREFTFGATIIIFLIFEPEGLAKMWKNIKDYFRLWPFSY